jgi:hypothetical protein
VLEMAKKSEQPEKEPTPLEQFVEHEKNAFVEASRALVSLVPSGLRKHGWNAIEEAGKGVGALAGAVVDGVSDVLRTAKDEIVPADDTDESTAD